MADPNTVSKAKVVIEGDISGVKTAVQESIKETEKLGNSADNTGSKISGAFGSAGQKIEDSTAGLRKFTGALSSTVGAVTAVTGAITGLTGVLLLLKNRHEAAEQAARSQRSAYNDLFRTVEDYRQLEITSAKEAEEAFMSVAKAIDSQNGIVERSRLDALFATAQQIEQEKILQGAVEDTKNAYEKQSQAYLEGARQQQQAIREIGDLIASQEINLLPDEQQLAAQIERQKKLITEAYEGIVLPEGLLEKAFENIDRIAERQLEAERERQRVADEAQARREAEADRRSQERIQREIEALEQAISGIFGADTTTVLTNINAGINELTQTIARRPHGSG